MRGSCRASNHEVRGQLDRRHQFRRLLRLERRHALVGEHVRALVPLIARVALHPVPRNLVPLRRGIELNDTNAALNDDMTKIITRIDELRSAQIVDTSQLASTPGEAASAKRADLSLYKTIEDT